MARAWWRKFKHKDGSVAYWINDIRDGKYTSRPIAAKSDREADLELEQYEIRKDLEKEGYDDQFAVDLGGSNK